MCECSIGVDVRDGTTILLISILSNIAMGCIVLGRQMSVDFGVWYTLPCISIIQLCTCTGVCMCTTWQYQVHLNVVFYNNMWPHIV